MSGWKALAVIAIFSTQLGNAIAQEECGELATPPGMPGPFDYRDPPAKQLAFVSQFHFTPDVEALRKGASTADIGGDLHFTLTVFPNHHRALLAMSRLAVKLKKRPPGTGYPVECYFERALRFQPDDHVARMIYGIHLLNTGDPTSAIRELEVAKKASPTNPNLLYNLGLAYFAINEYEKSLENAKQAYAMGFPLPGLRDKLQRAGQWHD